MPLSSYGLPTSQVPFTPPDPYSRDNDFSIFRKTFTLVQHLIVPGIASSATSLKFYWLQLFLML
jgi:hypothetical protein